MGVMVVVCATALFMMLRHFVEGSVVLSAHLRRCR
jgi:hypothetical protein